MYKAVLALAISVASPLLLGQEHRSELSQKVRTYYIAADAVDWDYAPRHMDQITGEKFHFEDLSESKGMLDPNATVYRKAIFREYTDGTFKVLKARLPAWERLGILGP